MKTARAPFVMLIALGLLAAVGCRTEPNRQEANADPTAQAKPQPAGTATDPNLLTLRPEAVAYARLQFTEVAEESLSAPLTVTGRVAIDEDLTVRVGSLFSGRILEVLVKAGDRVQLGQAMARMHTHEVHEAQAEYAKARAELKQRNTQAEFTRSVMERAERMYQAKAGSRNEWEKASVEHQAALQEVKRAEAELERAIGHREHLGLPDTPNYDEPVVITAPAAGVVMKREITPGTSVNPGDNLFFISDLSSVWAIAEVQEKDLSLVKLGSSVQLKVAAYPNAPFRGRITRTGEALNPQTRTVEVRCVVDNRLGKLKPEMYALISIDGLRAGERRVALTISESALQEVDGQTVVFVVRGPNQFEKRVIRVERRQGELVEVLSGLSRGERVVTKGGFQLKSKFSKDKLAEE